MKSHNRRRTVNLAWTVGVLALGAWMLLGRGHDDIPTLSQWAEDASGQVPVRFAAQKKKPVGDHPFPNRRASPELDGGVAWINTDGPLTLADLKGKFVLLDFWTYCCINCMHILPELKKLEQAYPNQIVVIGVHSAKFATEEDSKNIAEAVLRYEIEHPVINDSNHAVWDNFRVNSWPSLRVIDPEGEVIAQESGEVTFEVLDRFFKHAIPYYKENGLLDETPVRFELEAHSAVDTPLRFPGKVLADEASDRIYIADSNHNRIVVTQLDGSLVEIIGSGAIGRADGGYEQCSFNKPQGMALLGETLYVADTENHMLRKVDLLQKRVASIAGLGHQGHNAWPGFDRQALLNFGPKGLPKRFVGVPRATELNSPWDLLVHGEDLYIAMAGPHQIWKMTLDEKEIGPYAGNGREDIVDGALLPAQPYVEGFSSFAQPSGLASDGEYLYVADSEGSSIRAVPFDSKKKVKTVVGTSHLPNGRLFKFGDIDGTGRSVRLQHPLGVAFHEGLLYVADTYNNKLKVIDLDKKSCTTLVGQLKPGNTDEPATFDEPAGLSYAAGKLFVADTNNHAIRVVDLKSDNRVSTLQISGLQPPTAPAETAPIQEDAGTRVAVESREVKAVDEKVSLAVKLQLPEGYKVNPKAPMSYRVQPTTPQGAVDRTAIGKTTKLKEPAAEFEIPLPVTAGGDKDTVDVTVTYYYCKEGPGGLCKMGRVTWTVPFALAANAPADALTLEHVLE
ncbi:MAG: thioredoxin-like domain-containing protein [Pirellulales bacterium]